MISKNYKLSGFFSWSIINQDGSIASKSPLKNNLILNQGLDFPSVYYFADCFTYCAIGFGTTPPLLTDTGLVSEQKRSNIYYTENNGCRSYIDGDSFYMQRTFDFTPETQRTLYGEIGWSPESSPGNNLFSKSIMIDSFGNPGPIVVERNQFLRAIYTLQVTFNPASSTITLPSIVGWTTNGNSATQLIGLYGISTTGGSTIYDSGLRASEPRNDVVDIFISTGLQAISAFGNSGNYIIGTWPQRVTAQPYVSGTYTKIYHANYSRASGTGFISTLGIGSSGGGPTSTTFVHRLDAPQFKASDYELNLYFNYTWSQ